MAQGEQLARRVPFVEGLLDDMKLFAAVVEAGGFRPTAQRLSLPAFTISEFMRRLEDDLGIRLLHHNTSSVKPTEAGRLLLARLRPASR